MLSAAILLNAADNSPRRAGKLGLVVRLEVHDVEHDWWVYSTVLNGRAILVEDRKTGALGSIDDPTPEEWRRAFHAPSSPYPWPDAARVRVSAGAAI